jgi:hypothetical protein
LLLALVVLPEPVVLIHT